MRIAISGAGIAGPTLAYWLLRSGHEVLIVEEAPTLRSGGYVIDFWGVGYDIAEKIGLLPDVFELGCQVREVRFVDGRGRTRGSFSTGIFDRTTNGRFTSLRRSDLSALIFGTLDCDHVVDDERRLHRIDGHGRQLVGSRWHVDTRPVVQLMPI